MIDKILNSLDTPFTGECLFDHLDSIVFFIKCSVGRYQVVNDTFVSRCGLQSKSEIVGKTPSEVFGPELGSSYEQQDARILEAGESSLSRLELHIYPDGTKGWCLTHKVPLGNRSAVPLGLVGVSQDLRLPQKESAIYKQISRAVEHVESDLSATPTVRELAEMTGLSLYQFDRRMKSVFGINSKQWMMQRRIDKAQQLLSSTSIPISNVAHDIGYADQSAFSRQFRKATGLSPLQYRSSFID